MFANSQIHSTIMCDTLIALEIKCYYDTLNLFLPVRSLDRRTLMNGIVGLLSVFFFFFKGA